MGILLLQMLSGAEPAASGKRVSKKALLSLPNAGMFVRYLSAYEVRKSEAGDNARHVESLILRISKPRLNKNIGTLKEAGN